MHRPPTDWRSTNSRSSLDSTPIWEKCARSWRIYLGAQHRPQEGRAATCGRVVQPTAIGTAANCSRSIRPLQLGRIIPGTLLMPEGVISYDRLRVGRCAPGITKASSRFASTGRAEAERDFDTWNDPDRAGPTLTKRARLMCRCWSTRRKKPDSVGIIRLWTM